MVAKDDAAIKQAVVNLIMTIPGERPFNNKLGSTCKSVTMILGSNCRRTNLISLSI